MPRPLVAVAGVPIVAGGVTGWRQGAVAAPASYLEALDRAGADGAILMPAAVDLAAAAARLSTSTACCWWVGAMSTPRATALRPDPRWRM